MVENGIGLEQRKIQDSTKKKTNKRRKKTEKLSHFSFHIKGSTEHEISPVITVGSLQWSTNRAWYVNI